MVHALLWGFCLALGNVSLALLTAWLVRDIHELQRYFRIFIIGLSVRTIVTLILFGVLYLGMGEHRLSFGLSFILSFAAMLGVEVFLIHWMELRHTQNVPVQLQRRASNNKLLNNDY